jgi:hypothetical protein
MERWLHLPLQANVSKFSATIAVPHKSTPHLRKINAEAHGNKKETKATKSKKKTGKPKHSGFHNE